MLAQDNESMLIGFRLGVIQITRDVKMHVQRGFQLVYLDIDQMYFDSSRHPRVLSGCLFPTKALVVPPYKKESPFIDPKYWTKDLTMEEAENVYGCHVLLQTLSKVTKKDPSIFYEFWNTTPRMTDLRHAKTFLLKIIGEHHEYGFNFKSPWIKEILRHAKDMLDGTMTFEKVLKIFAEQNLSNQCITNKVTFYTLPDIVEKVVNNKKLSQNVQSLLSSNYKIYSNFGLYAHSIDFNLRREDMIKMMDPNETKI